MPTLTNVSGGSGHLNELHSLILNEHWDLGTAYILTNSKAEIDIRFEGGVPIFSAACTRNAPLPFLKKLLYRLKDKERTRSVNGALLLIEEGTSLWLFLYDLSTSGQVFSAIKSDTVAFEGSLISWRANGPEHNEAARSLLDLQEWGIDDASLLDITMGDRQDTPYFVRTVVLAVLCPYILNEGENKRAKEAMGFVQKFMLDFEGFTPGSEQGVAQLRQMNLALVHPNVLGLLPKVIRVDFFRRLYEKRMEELKFSDYFDTGDTSILGPVLSACKVYLLRVPGITVMKDMCEVASYLLEVGDWEEGGVGEVTLREIGSDMKSVFSVLEKNKEFEDSYVPSFKNVCGAIVDCVGYFALCTPGGEDFGTSREFRHKMFVAKQVLHSEFYLHIKSESRNIRRGRGVHGRDLVSMSEEQRLGFVGNSVLSQMAGANAKFWAREGYEGKLLRTCRGDIKGTEGELNRLEVVSELNQAARKHVEGNAGMVGVEEDDESAFLEFLRAGRSAYAELVKAVEVRKKASVHLVGLLESEGGEGGGKNNFGGKNVMEVGDKFVEFCQIMEKEEDELHHFVRGDKKLVGIRRKRNGVLKELGVEVG